MCVCVCVCVWRYCTIIIVRGEKVRPEIGGGSPLEDHEQAGILIEEFGVCPEDVGTMEGFGA